jgi:F0F1-type ATP synthase membrane subunit b/b'
MKINITFFIQIINFTITYFVLKKLIFGPVIKSINQKNKEKELFLNFLKQEEIQLLEAQKQENDQLIDFQERMSQLYKKPKTKPIKVDLDITYQRNELEVQQLVAKIKDSLIEEVPRVR